MSLPPQPHYSEMPDRGQRVVLGCAVFATAVFGAWWIAGGAGLDPNDTVLGMVIGALVVAEWVGMGLLLRPRGRGLRLARWRRSFAWTFGASHVLFAVLNAFVPVFVPARPSGMFGTGRWGFCAGFFAVGCAFAYAAWRAGRPERSASPT